MDGSMIARVLWLRRGLCGHERWSEATLREHQRRRLTELRQFATWPGTARRSAGVRRLRRL
jgi:hypothetical protein